MGLNLWKDHHQMDLKRKNEQIKNPKTYYNSLLLIGIITISIKRHFEAFPISHCEVGLGWVCPPFRLKKTKPFLFTSFCPFPMLARVYVCIFWYLELSYFFLKLLFSQCSWLAHYMTDLHASLLITLLFPSLLHSLPLRNCWDLQLACPGAFLSKSTKLSFLNRLCLTFKN